MQASTENNEEDLLSTDILAVLKKTEELHRALASLTSTNSSLRFYSQKLLTRLSEFAKDFSKVPQELCNICFESPKNHVLLPCSHCFCEACADRR